MHDILKQNLLSDVEKIGMKLGDCKIELRDYSKSYYGCYRLKTNKIILYVYSTPDKKKMYSYRELLFTLIHEIIHYMQWSDPKFKRISGVMHDPTFHKMYNHYTNIAGAKLLMREVQNNEQFKCRAEQRNNN